ncbi:uncharacterized protein ColSpa_00214 [Colletotrichum spaethianum]|uniref:Uncharacterized protein n=1 Tax=Colletotrichum spaethianum TaxID=700344 RepID=A0AA37L137_9PEZI|nr:uncharacterized protein ColSpa_00214 [Colletotrichum spaethianum]GKT40033.1 hypothetical protein ColSpa_00214 [Colletotrichum spaethianum]
MALAQSSVKHNGRLGTSAVCVLYHDQLLAAFSNEGNGATPTDPMGVPRNTFSKATTMARGMAATRLA